MVALECRFVGEVDTARALRVRHRLGGTAVGTLPQISQQNVFLGLPLLLSPEECAIAASLGLAIDSPSRPDDSIEGGREDGSSRRQSRTECLRQPTLPVRSASNRPQVDADEAARRSAAILSAYTSLWRLGYHLGSALRFGGHFLVYPGDSLRYHSHFVATVLPDVDAPFSPLGIVAHGRLSTAVKKAHLLCACVDGRRDPPADGSGDAGRPDPALAPRATVFLTVEWAAM